MRFQHWKLFHSKSNCCIKHPQKSSETCLFYGTVHLMKTSEICNLLNKTSLCFQSLFLMITFIIKISCSAGFTRRVDLYRIHNKAGLILTTYCVRYPGAVPFLRNKMPFSLLKPLKIHVVSGGGRGDGEGWSILNYALLLDFLSLFLLCRTHARIFWNKPCKDKEQKNNLK